MHRIATLATASILAGGCAVDRNSLCEWPLDESASPAESVHLAEDLAIRYADAQGKRGAWRSDRDACEARLFQTVAERHKSTVAGIEGIREGFARRRPDLAVYGPMLGLSALAAWWLVQAATRRFGASEVIPRAVAVALICQLTSLQPTPAW